MIRSIDKSTVHRICSGQGIPDLAVGVKELVENAIDANATRVEIKIKNYGYDSFEVIDNGSGISPENFETLVKKHHTSKIHSFEDLSNVSSFGFRGEALSSLSELCGTGGLVITTKCKDQKAASCLKFHADGSIQSNTPCARPVGTSVLAEELFKPLPVRRREFKRNMKRQYSKMLYIVQAYGLISSGVRLNCSNFVKGKRIKVISTSGSKDIKQNIVSIFGAKFVQGLTPITLQFGVKEEDSEEDEKFSCTVKGFVSKNGAGIGKATAGDRQFIYINGRPVNFPKAAKAVNESWRKYELNHKPAFIIDFQMPQNQCDVNLTPDKRDVFIVSEDIILRHLREQLESLWKPAEYTYTARTIDHYATPRQEHTTEQVESDKVTKRTSGCCDQGCREGDHEKDCKVIFFDSQKEASSEKTVTEGGNTDEEEVEATPQETNTSDNSSIRQNNESEKASDTSSDVAPFQASSKREREQTRTLESIPEHQSTDEPTTQSRRKRAKKADAATFSSIFAIPEDSSEQNSQGCGTDDNTPIVDNSSHSDYTTEPKQRSSKDAVDEAAVQEISDVTPVSRIVPMAAKKTRKRALEYEGSDFESSVSCNRDPIKKKPATRSQKSNASLGRTKRRKGVKKLKFGGFSEVKKEFLQRVELEKELRASNASKTGEGGVFGELGVENVNHTAVATALEKVFRKSDFADAQVLGQFNLGFIIARIRDDLFILDQHASDEIYNFERLQNTTKVHNQKLIARLPLDLSAAETQTVLDNLPAFERNGFKFTSQDQGVLNNQSASFESVEKGSATADESSGSKIFLTAVPQPENFKTQFGAEDVRELASMLRNDPSVRVGSKIPLLPKTRAMFASKACRSSIMIGDALEKKTMFRVVKNLSTLERPWNCPHGRPTMRHLIDLSTLYSKKIAQNENSNFKGDEYFKV